MTSIDLIKENNFPLRKSRRSYPTQIIIDANYANDLSLLANTLAQSESSQLSQEQAAGVIDPSVTANVHVFLMRRGHFHSKFVDLSRNISST